MQNIKKNIIMTDELIDMLGKVFVHQEIREKYGITFEKYVDRWKNDTLHLYIQ